MAPGTKLMSPDGIIGIVTPNNTISLSLPPDYTQRVTAAHLHRKFFVKLFSFITYFHFSKLSLQFKMPNFKCVLLKIHE